MCPTKSMLGILRILYRGVSLINTHTHAHTNHPYGIGTVASSCAWFANSSVWYDNKLFIHVSRTDDLATHPYELLSHTCGWRSVTVLSWQNCVDIIGEHGANSSCFFPNPDNFFNIRRRTKFLLYDICIILQVFSSIWYAIKYRIDYNHPGDIRRSKK